ncbi:cytochrome P450 oxidoreductase, putative [Pseudomonas fluorescens Q2-87]|uniref:Cytochrome P450 oxidoreductase, putative n=1 Tax=Pseudomonas fluorescens (strain Q2-87) TaxID=1038922 RepID=J2ED05_PSEFQ|nr:cytochrome P450 [Pseudomonas fluorescens]EJL01130.1 cytochrome P450 oxidoreductase, putative [Pseudomonas fluorescens Q2-87]
MDPIIAATHPDPYPYYASLRAKGGLTFDRPSNLWIASSAEAVCAVLRHPDCQVRPADEPVPKAIAEGPAGRVFGQLMRMNEGERHRCPRAAIAPGLQDVDPQRIEDLVRARFLREGAEGLRQAQFIGPVSVIAALLGFNPADSRLVSELTTDFVACLSPLSDATQLAAAHRASEQLARLFNERTEARDNPLLMGIGQGFEGADPDNRVANLIGLLSQTFDATAGLIGNALLALIRNPELHQTLKDDATQISPLLAEIQRFDPPVQNTRRFVAAPCQILGTALEPAATILVLLASANRDPQLNPQPDALLLERANRRSFSFGTGRHECPGQTLALEIARATLGTILARELSLDRLAWRYRPSLNGRIPQFSDRP